jgi:thymidine phosphorylase
VTTTQLLESLSYIHAKIFGHTLLPHQIQAIIKDTLNGRLSDLQIAAFIAVTANNKLNKSEITELTKAMVKTGEQLTWDTPVIVDKHCIGGLPGNRTTLIVVPIIAAYGLIIPKTSSRAITSPAGTADTMEVFAPVTLNTHAMRQVVEKENGCIVWGGAFALSPADDVLVRIERALDLDSEGQMVASILSKKVAAGSTHVVIDIPVGDTAKIRTADSAMLLKNHLENIGKKVGLTIETIFTDGSQPVGRGIGPCLEARDVMQVLQNKKEAPQDLRDRALTLAGMVLEFSDKVKKGTGKKLATDLLDNGKAWEKFQAICIAQGGMTEPTLAPHHYTVHSEKTGDVVAIDNRSLAKIAKLAGAPQSKSAGIDMHVALGMPISAGQPLLTIHAESTDELNYALSFIKGKKHEVISLGEPS